MADGPAVELTQEQKIIVAAVVKGVQESLKHECFFSSDSRKLIHDFVDAVGETEATRGTHILILSAGKAWQDVTKKLTRFVMWSVIVAIAVLVSLFAGKPVLNWFK